MKIINSEHELTMGKYGEVAIRAIELFQSKEVRDPNEAWGKAAEEIFANSISGREKGCPKGAFLGLCSEGYIKGIPIGNYTDSVKNKSYALLAVDILISNPTINDANLLWNMVTKNRINHNMQMDVVLALWKEGYINYHQADNNT